MDYRCKELNLTSVIQGQPIFLPFPQLIRAHPVVSLVPRSRTGYPLGTLRVGGGGGIARVPYEIACVH